MRVLPYGEQAVLAELEDPRTVPAVRAAVAGADGVLDAVAGARTVLVRFDPSRTTAAAVATALDSGSSTAAAPLNEPLFVEVAVVYDGADLAEVAQEVGWSPEAVVAAHCAGDYTVRFCGFAPGFAYLDGLHPRLHVARRATPRTAVPAGAVAVAGEFTGIYPRASPGGWRLLGHTDASLWDAARTPPALLAPGTRVRFVPR